MKERDPVSVQVEQLPESEGHSNVADNEQLFTSDETGEEVEEVLIEPRFKYSRILGDISQTIISDRPSSIAVHHRFMAVGTGSGRIYLFDHLGNRHSECTARHHKCAVSFISIDGPGDYLASCANDFTFSLFGIGGSDEYNQKILLKEHARVVAIAPDFARSSSGQRCVIGNKNLVLSERTFYATRREIVLYKGNEKDGFISAALWNDKFVAFTNESGTRIYDVSLRQTITLVLPLHRIEQFYCSKFPPKLAWLDESTIAVGWANTLCIFGIFTGPQNPRNVEQKSNRESSRKHGKILHRSFLSEFLISGISYTTSTPHDISLIANNNISSSFDQTRDGDSSLSATTPPYFENLRNFSVNSIRSLLSSPSSLAPVKDNKQQKGPTWKELVLFGVKFENITDERTSDTQIGSPPASGGTQFLSDSRSSRSDRSTCSTAITTHHFGEIVKDITKRKFSTQLLLICPTGFEEYQTIAEDTIEMRQIESEHLNILALGAIPIDNIYFLMGNKELIEAHPCSIDERIQWFLDNELFAQALELAIINSDRLKEIDSLDVGRKFINHLLENNEFETAAKHLPKICLCYKDQWENYVSEFEHRGQILKLVPVIPIRDPKLEPECYETILRTALYASPKLFRAIVGRWNGEELYRTPAIIDQTIRRIKTADDSLRQNDLFQGKYDSDELSKLPKLDKQQLVDLYRALAQLFIYNHEFDKSVKIYLLLKDPAIFGLINRYRLFQMVKDRIVELMDISSDQAIRMLLDNEDLLPSTQVLNQLGRNSRLQMAYLQRLQSRGEGNEHSNKLVQLLVEFDRPSLLPFLRKNEFYKIDTALEICRQKRYVEEVVFLLGRSGNRMEALDLTIKKLDRIDMALELCVEHDDDPELWQRLIDLAINRPEHISYLLSVGGSFIDPLRIVEKIPPDLKIPNLKQSIMKVLHNYDLQIRILKHSRNVAVHDLMENFNQIQGTELVEISE